MTSRERLLRALRGEPTDRVPISTYELVGWNPDAWENREPSYRGLMDLVRASTDCIYMWDSGGIDIAPELLQVERREEDGVLVTRTVCRAPHGPLTKVTREAPHIKTVWQVEHLLKTAEDIRNFLETPLAVAPPDGAEHRRRSAALGENGIMMHSISDALCLTSELFSFQDFLLFCATEPRLVRRLLDMMQGRVLAYTQALLATGFGPLFRICGPEYATPPYLPPERFREYVVAYDTPLIDLIHRHGAYARLHCHGRIGQVLDAIMEMEPDGLDPVEPPPDGDLELAAVKKRTRGRVTLFGNLELKTLEHAGADEVQDLTRRALREGMPGGRFVLMPTAAPINIPLSPKTEENYRAYIATALKHGVY
ncbi:MAG TPA: uroporphyrinogen decarboxylase family protein [Planctomycetota bacterium]|jgi:hypothetical protein|nr:hypothetical protein [Planctomycetota bacterium]OQC19163.1 MAG: methylcobalamin:coenzyme M methyltransferase [Planctomycetes bacterium ADurb.Bin069]NMD34655.1 hypothetical protein [Planctomycetota bacterium]HNS00432.1 uroporphyrinogen decarboxylase family protein [Planctomycetota bacterium]HNU27513.1 uroporphyrinogen decarboxylase family protein [Planctomycetota bacterium]